MNSMPADSSARRIAKSLAVVSEVALSDVSARLIVFTPNDECLAKSWALHLNSARAALIWPLVNGAIALTSKPIWVIFTHIGELHLVG